MTTILSSTAQYRATVAKVPEGIAVAVRTVGGRADPGRQVHRVVVDAPHHVVLDRVVAMLGEMERGL
jgi:hypothetical protein